MPGTRADYSVDYADGRLYIWYDEELAEDDEITIYYSLHFPATYIDFSDESVPDEDAHIKVLYSAFRIVYKVDKFIHGIDGLWQEDGDSYNFWGPLTGPMYEGDYPLYLRYGPIMWFDFAEDAYDNWITVMYGDNYTQTMTLLDPMYWHWNPWEGMHTGMEAIWIDWSMLELSPGDVIEITYPIFAGRYEWTTVGTKSAAVDSAGASMVTEGFRQWNNFDTKLGSLGFQDTTFGPEEPFMFRPVGGTGDDREDYYDDQLPQVYTGTGRAHLKDDWCTTLPIASSNIIVVGGPFANLASEYFNDFTDVYVPRLGSLQTTGFYSHACWGRNQYQVEYVEGEQTTGYAIISTYKDINGTIGLIVYGWTGQDTYYATYALQHGLLKIMQSLQPGATSLVLEFDYTVHPAEDCFFHIVECLGTITECSGFEYQMWYGMVEYDDVLIHKMVINSYSSEFWAFHTYIDYGVPYYWNLPNVIAIEITYPQYIYFHWETKVHPDP
jgi:hypothetical protein